MNYSKFCTVATKGQTVSSSIFIIPSRLSKEKQEQLKAELQKKGINAVSADELNIGKTTDSDIGQKINDSKAVLTEVTKPFLAEMSSAEASVASVPTEASVAKVTKASVAAEDSVAAESSIDSDASEASNFFEQMERITGGSCFRTTAIGEGAMAISHITFAR